MSCYKTSDNKFFGCPPRMADGRHFTDYRPHCYRDSVMIAENGLNNSFQYRQFLQQNGTQIMDINRKYACMKNCCTPCQGEPGTMLPESDSMVCDKRSCKLVKTGNNSQLGLGTGRAYYENGSNNCAFNTCPDQKPNGCMKPSDAFNYYPDHLNNVTMTRAAVPGGGMPITEGGDFKLYN